MPSKIQHSFHAGEWSPYLEDRADLEKYSAGCKTLENFLITSYGPVRRRPGTEYIQGAISNSAASRLFRFQFSADTGFVLEMGPSTMTIFKDRAQVASGIAHSYTASQLREIQTAQVNDLMWFVHPEHPVRLLTRVSDSSWTFEDIDYTNPPFREENIDESFTVNVDAVSGSGATMTASQNLFDTSSPSLHIGAYFRIGHVQEVSSVLLTLRDNPAGTRSGTAEGVGWVSDALLARGSWELSTFGFWTGVLELQKRNSTTGAWVKVRDWQSPDANRNFSATGLVDEDDTYLRLYFVDNGDESSAGTPNATLELVNPTVYGVVKVTAVASATSATVDIVRSLSETSNTDLWAEGSWSDFRGYPKTITLHEQRMIYGGNSAESQTIWGSDVDSYNEFTIADNEDSDSFQYTLGSDQYNEIQWMATSPRNLMVGTSGGEYSFSSGSDEELITPTNVRARRESVHGAAHIQAISTSNVIFFVEKGARKFRELAYSFEQDGFISTDLIQLSEHLGSGGIKEVAIQRHRDVVMWIVTGDGNLLSLTYDREQNVVGWATHSTDGAFESVVVIDTGGEEEEVWFCIKRTINGATKYYIESFYPDMWRLQELEDQDDLFYVDSGVLQNRPDVDVHDGTDSTLWTGNSVSGTAATFNSTAQAYEGTKSTLWTTPALNSIIEYDSGGTDVSVDLYSGITFQIYVATTWDASDEFTVSLYDQSTGAVGSTVNLSDYVTESTTGAWQAVSIPIVDFAATGDTFDTIRFTVSAVSGAGPTIHLDAIAVQNVAPNTSSVTSLAHLEGKSVSVLNKGAVEPSKTVSSGSISTKNPANGKLIVGLSYDSVVTPLPIEINTEQGTSQGIEKRIHETIINVYKSGAFKAGDESTLNQVYTRDTSDLMDVAPPLVSKSYCITMPPRTDKKVVVKVMQNLPLPLTIFSIVSRYRITGK